MGDREGAREVLQDLLGEAQGALKDEAQALLDKISS
jgi:pilus assembly protein FimV